MAETEKSFWHTAAGVITAVAALITAIGGVLAILVQNGVIGGDRDGEKQVVVGAPGGARAGEALSGDTTAPSTPASALTPWAKATATLTRKDGTSATVKAPTVGLACDTGTLAFENGQRVSLELVRSIRFDAIYTENSSADGVVTLLDGREQTDPIHTWNCPVTGATELGPLEVKLADIKRIDFHR
jgi:hypothetical protein